MLRHGQASFGAADYDELSELGRRQAVVAGDVLAARGLRDPLVISGSLRRQRDTAALAAERLGVGLPGNGDARWNEYDHVGMVGAVARAEGMDGPLDAATFQAILDRALTAWIQADEPDGWRGFAGGAMAALHDLVGTLDGRDAVVATSGGVIAAVCGSLLGLPAEGLVALNRVTINAALTTIVAGRSGLSLLTFNDHAHFCGQTAQLRTYR